MLRAVLAPSLLLVSLVAPALAQARLASRFAADVDREHPHAEHPRPQWVRERWQSLNGPWSYAIEPRTQARPGPAHGEIVVPFPVESMLSGVERRVSPDERLWYWRSFTLAHDSARDRTLLHFGAVDWEAQVWVNGAFVGEHRGGYDPFSFDVGWALREGAVQEIAVAVWDPTDAGTQPRGKQVHEPHGIWYTPSTGIWQSVWIEHVPVAHVERARYATDPARRELAIRASVQGWREGMRLVARATLDGGQVVEAATSEPAPDESLRLVLSLPGARPWTPEDPALYDLELVLARGADVLDRVTSYFGLRSIELGKDAAGIPRLLLNGVPRFQLGLLDQGFWPDGLYTAPTDEALRYDVEATKALGFDLARKHVKVEPARWYHWCDRLGLLVWQDMPSGDAYIGPDDPDIERDAQSARQLEVELAAVMDALHNHPSIVSWVVFNEGWGQWETERMARWVKERDPSRIVNSASGWTDRGVGDVHDVHVYPGPAMPPIEPERAAVLGEFGGLGQPIAGHTWQDEENWGYRSFASSEELTSAYERLAAELPFLAAKGLCAAVYTQTTDVEIEVNGVMTYDRALVKMDPDRVREANRRARGPAPELVAIAAAADGDPRSWRWTTEAPGEGWQAASFDDSGWSEGAAGFGTAETPGAVVRTEWSTDEIWLRRRFRCGRAPSGPIALWIHHDEDVEVHLNGEPIASLAGYRTSYGLVPLDDAARARLVAGENVLAVHCRQTRGGQYVDVGLVEIVEAR